MSDNNPIVRVENVTKTYNQGDVVALDSVSLDVREGDLFTLLGPSGSGKTTLLRIIVGVEKPDEGRVILDGKDVTDLPANKRDVGIIYQDFGLFPHKTVGENIAFPLKMKGVGKNERRDEVLRMLDFVDLSGYEDRAPEQLSAGEKQRVAIARGLVSEPKVLLLDEPLANLDRALRDVMEVELRKYQRETGSFIYVTHNQEEALTLSDTIGIMRNAQLEQVGDVFEVYDHPKTAFVAGFVGRSNHYVGRVEDVVDGSVELRVDGQSIRANTPVDLQPGDEAELFIKHERIRLGKNIETDNVFSTTIRERIMKGPVINYLVDLLDQESIVTSTNTADSEIRDRRREFEPGTDVEAGWDAEDARVFKAHSNPGP